MQSRIGSGKHGVGARTAWAGALLAAACVASVRAADTDVPPRDFTDLSLEELLDLKVTVTTVSKRAVPLKEAPAAVFVLSGEEIRRSGVRTIADALRMVPGLLVVRITAQSYVVTSRGFPGEKLEVFIDGRSVYTPLTSIVFWDVLDTYMPDIDRIEVVRGPGSILTLWGANAMNGVVNIVTKHSARTAGTAVSGGGGNEERSFAALRTGARVADDAYARFYVQTRHRDSSRCGQNTTACTPGEEAPDDQSQVTAGFRADWDYASARSLTLSGDAYTEHAGTVSAASRAQSFQQDTEQNGGNLTAHWDADLGPSGKLSAVAYVAHYYRFLPEIFLERRDTYDLELEHRLPLGERHLLTWALGARSTRDETGGRPLFAIFDPSRKTLSTYAASLQDQIRLFDDGELTLGSKLEHNDFTGFEVQPGIRLGWRLGDGAYTWTSVARAVRTPNRLEDGLVINCVDNSCGPLVVPALYRQGNTEMKSEKLIAYDWGLRLWREGGWSVDLAVFFNDYEDLKSSEARTVAAPFGYYANTLAARSWGGELAAGVPLASWASMRLFYSRLHVDVRREPGSTDAVNEGIIEGSSPEQSAGVQLSLQPRGDVSVDSFVRYVDELPAVFTPAYVELNTRMAWRPTPSLELALVGENLLDADHPESGSPASGRPPGPANPIQRSVFAEFRWTWQ